MQLPQVLLEFCTSQMEQIPTPQILLQPVHPGKKTSHSWWFPCTGYSTVLCHPAAGPPNPSTLKPRLSPDPLPRSAFTLCPEVASEELLLAMPNTLLPTWQANPATTCFWGHMTMSIYVKGHGHGVLLCLLAAPGNQGAFHPRAPPSLCWTSAHMADTLPRTFLLTETDQQ